MGNLGSILILASLMLPIVACTEQANEEYITMAMLDITTKVTGVRLCFTDEEGTSMSHEEKIRLCLKDSLWPITIEMPCGETFTFKSLSEFPQKTLMCPCGDKNHVVVDINF